MRRWFKARPFLTALLVLLAVATPGFIRIENLAQANRSRIIETAEIQARLEANRRREAARDLIEGQERCEFSVETRDNLRLLFPEIAIESGEALIEASGSTNTEVIERYRVLLRSRVQARLDELFPPTECVDGVLVEIEGD